MSGKNRKKRAPMSPSQILEKIRKAGLSEINVIKSDASKNDLQPLVDRLHDILSINDNHYRNPKNMLFFVMYDIESNKVRRLVAKYLLREGCHRIQHSVYLADLPIEKFDEIKNDLADVQAAYDNTDSILVVPISTDYLKAMKVIGKMLNVDVITHSKNTLFF